MSLLYDVFAAVREPLPAGKIRIQLTNSAQGAHLFQTLRGHCEVDMLPGSEGTAVVVSSSPSGSKGILRRLDAWLSEFGVESISLELDGRTYEMRKA